MDAGESLGRVVDATYEKRAVTSSTILATAPVARVLTDVACCPRSRSDSLHQTSLTKESELVNEVGDASPPLLGRQSCSQNGQFHWYRGRTWWPSTAVPADLEITAAATVRR